MSHRASVVPSPPDLQILVRREPPKALAFEVCSNRLCLQNQPVGSLSLADDPKALAQKLDRLVYDLSDLAKEGKPGQESAREKLADLAVDLFKLPPALKELLWSHKDEIETVQILSDEPYIPWELLKLQGKRGEEGPFLCEAFAVTRWLREFRQAVFRFLSRGSPSSSPRTTICRVPRRRRPT